MLNQAMSHFCPASFYFVVVLILVVPLPTSSSSSCRQCNTATSKDAEDAKQILSLKSIAIFSILTSGAAGVLLPILGRSIPLLSPDSNLFFSIKSFAAGVILGTAFIHILPDAFARLTSPCLPANPWHIFPFAGFVAMSSAMGTMTIDSLATGYYKRSHFRKPLSFDGGRVSVDAEAGHAGHVHVHTHASHGHAHGPAAGGQSAAEEASMAEKIRHRVISQVLELGIVVHSVIIGVSLGTSESGKIIKPLVAALSFHQFFEGIGLGGCIVQANFKVKAMAIMAVFFSLTAPFGIAIGIAISSIYDSDSSTALITEGILDAASSGILIYMSLVDLLAADFTDPRMQSSIKLQLASHLTLLLGSGFMSIVAKWA